MATQQQQRTAAPAKPAARIKVRATRIGYYDLSLRREGDVFTIADERAFSDNWMERVDGNTPERNTGSQADINRTNDGLRSSGGTGDVEVI